MMISLPIAIGLTLLLALLVMRSIRYAAMTMVPILLVVAWVYGFMYLTGYTINVITATIAAIAIGVGIDYATHFTVRFREEFQGEPSRFPALRRAGEGTGGALAISALTSITGFVVMAFSPMPMFRTFGVLTAVMIFFALLVSLLVLPSLLILPFVTPSRRGEERAELEEAITGGEFEYEPHARETADLRHPLTGVVEADPDADDAEPEDDPEA
jgi:predicted RND superfamily exporter protein